MVRVARREDFAAFVDPHRPVGEPVGQVALATFPAPNGLRSTGQTKWQATGESGAAVFGNPGLGTYGEMISGALERSNVDLAEEMVGLITAQRNFQANARAIDTATTISQTVNINAGTYNVGVFAAQGGWNLNWIKFTKL